MGAEPDEGGSGMNGRWDNSDTDTAGDADIDWPSGDRGSNWPSGDGGSNEQSDGGSGDWSSGSGDFSSGAWPMPLLPPVLSLPPPPQLLLPDRLPPQSPPSSGSGDFSSGAWPIPLLPPDLSLPPPPQLLLPDRLPPQLPPLSPWPLLPPLLQPRSPTSISPALDNSVDGVHWGFFVGGGGAFFFMLLCGVLFASLRKSQTGQRRQPRRPGSAHKAYEVGVPIEAQKPMEAELVFCEPSSPPRPSTQGPVAEPERSRSPNYDRTMQRVQAAKAQRQSGRIYASAPVLHEQGSSSSLWGLRAET